MDRKKCMDILCDIASWEKLDPEARDVLLTTWSVLQYLRDEDFEDFNNTRVCTQCNKVMLEGYCIHDGEEYYCSDKCLHQNYTTEEYLEMYDDGNGDSYWTEWY